MYLKIIILAFLVFSFSSCEFLQKKLGVNIQDLELDTIVNIHAIDVYPAFAICDSVLDNDQKKRCFKSNLYKHFSAILLEHTFSSTKSIHETVNVKVRIDNEGVSHLVGIDSVSLVREEIPILDSLIAVSVKNLPKLIPAKKRGIDVSTEYVIPIRIDIE